MDSDSDEVEVAVAGVALIASVWALDCEESAVGSKSAMPQAEARAIERLERRARDAVACSRTPAQRDWDSWI